MRLNRRKFLIPVLLKHEHVILFKACHFRGINIFNADCLEHYPSRRWQEQYRVEPGLSPYGFSYYAPGLEELPLTWRQYWRYQHATNRRKHDTRRN